MNIDFTAEELIQFCSDNAMPNAIYSWNMDKNTLRDIRSIKKKGGEYIWDFHADNFAYEHGAFLGYEINITKQKCFDLVVQFSDGSHKIIPFKRG